MSYLVRVVKSTFITVLDWVTGWYIGSLVSFIIWLGMIKLRVMFKVEIKEKLHSIILVVKTVILFATAITVIVELLIQ